MAFVAMYADTDEWEHGSRLFKCGAQSSECRLQSFDRAGAKELGPTRANFFLFFSGAVDDFRLVQTLGPAPLKKMWVLGGRVL